MTFKYQPFSWSRLLVNQTIKNPKTPPLFSRKISAFPQFPTSQTPHSPLPQSEPLPNASQKRPTKTISYFSRKISSLLHFGSSRAPKLSLLTRNHFSTSSSYEGAAERLLADLEREKQREREARKRGGLDTKDIDAEDEEDYMGVGPLIEKLEKEKVEDDALMDLYEEPTDSDSDEDDERFSREAVSKRLQLFEKKFERFEELLQDFNKADTLDEAFRCMKKIDKFEQKHFPLRPEYRVIGELMNRLKVAERKEKFILQQKLNRAMRLVEWKEAYDPNNPANYGVIRHQQVGPNVDALESNDKEERMIQGGLDDVNKDDDDDEEEFDEMKERDDILLEKLNAIDKKLEEKLAELDHTFGKKGKLLEEEIRDLAEERNSLTEKKRRPLYRKVSYCIFL